MKGVKIVLIGPSGTGKTCFINRVAHGEWLDSSMPTIGMSFTIVRHSLSREMAAVHDTCGLEKFSMILPIYTRSASCILLFRDPKTSIDEYRNWEQIVYNEPCPIIRVLAKSDLNVEPLFYQNNVEYSCSALKGHYCQEIMDLAIDKALEFTQTYEEKEPQTLIKSSLNKEENNKKCC